MKLQELWHWQRLQPQAEAGQAVVVLVLVPVPQNCQNHQKLRRHRSTSFWIVCP